MRRSCAPVYFAASCTVTYFDRLIALTFLYDWPASSVPGSRSRQTALAAVSACDSRRILANLSLGLFTKVFLPKAPYGHFAYIKALLLQIFLNGLASPSPAQQFHNLLGISGRHTYQARCFLIRPLHFSSDPLVCFFPLKAFSSGHGHPSPALLRFFSKWQRTGDYLL